ncbi:MAG: Phosphoadenylyl-sulfate reductase [thioredoxin], partial [uncultured Solirubrobacteraceae bacterium]
APSDRHDWRARRGGRAVRPHRDRLLVPEGGDGRPRPRLGDRARALRRLHARHRRAVRRDDHRVAQDRGALRHHDRGRPRPLARAPVGDRSRRVLQRPQGRAAAGAPRRLRRVGDRPAPRAVADPRRHDGDQLGREARAVQGGPARGVDREGRLAPDRRPRPAVPRAPRPGLQLDRLRALHAAGRGPGGPLGGDRQARVRPARGL